MKLTGRTPVELVGRGVVTLTSADHIATGGEASVYRKGNDVIKLYTDPRHLAHPAALENLRRLSGLTHPYVVAPRGLVLNNRQRPIGYYMDFVEGEALARVFTNDFRRRSGFDDDDARTLVDEMFQVLRFAHGSNAIMVDPNELNWTTIHDRGTRRHPRVLDVDSWLSGSYRPVSVPMMPSIRDWHAPISQESDRFALGVVTFQVLTGVHPYKGALDGYKPSEMTRRMQDNASVFTRGVRLNQAVRDFGCIPSPLLDWYEAVFQHGDRSVPPSPFAKAAVPSRTVTVARVVTTSQETLHYRKLLELNGDSIARVFPCGVVLTTKGRLIDIESKRVLRGGLPENSEVIGVEGGWLIAASDSRGDHYVFISRMNFEAIELTAPRLKMRRLMRYQDRLFVVTDQGLTELALKQLGRPIVAVGETWRTMINSTQWFDGVGVLDAMGARFLIAPFGPRSCAQIRVKELDSLHILAAVAGPRFVSVVGIDGQGAYRKLEFTFDRSYKSYTVWRGDADSAEINMALLPSGVVATVVRDGELVVFVPTANKVNRADDKDITTDMRLSNWYDRVVYIMNGQLWHVSMS